MITRLELNTDTGGVCDWLRGCHVASDWLRGCHVTEYWTLIGLVESWHPEVALVIATMASRQRGQSPVLLRGQLSVMLLQTALPVVLLLRKHPVLFIREESSVVGVVTA